MTALKSRIARLIAASGPMSVADYMAMCLFDPEAGYYTTREPFGRSGDFVTAPEVSQMFGELTAVWLTMRWREAGSPKDAIIAEIGPGRVLEQAGQESRHRIEAKHRVHRQQSGEHQPEYRPDEKSE